MFALAGNSSSYLRPSLVPETQLFLNATGLSSDVDRSAANFLIKGLIDNSLWTKTHVLYPMMGSTSATLVVNAKNPGTNNMTITGAPTFGSGGITWTGGGTSFGDTAFLDSSLTFNNCGVHVYLRTENSTGYIWGCSDAVSPNNECRISSNAALGLGMILFGGETSIVTNTTKGLLSANNSANRQFWQNGVQIVNSGAATNTSTGLSMLIGATRGVASSSIAQYAFAALTQGFSAAEMNTFYSIVQGYQTLLSRAV